MAKELVFNPSAYGRPTGRPKRAKEINSEAPASSACRPTEQVEEKPARAPAANQESKSPCATEHTPSETVLSQSKEDNNSVSREVPSPTILGDLIFKPNLHQNKSKPLSLAHSIHSPVSNSRRASDKTSTVNQPALQKSQARVLPPPSTLGQPSVVTSNIQSDIPNMSLNEHLRQLQIDSLQSISRKMAASRKKGKDKNDTTSLRDLDLARTPVNSKKPGESRRTWADDSPVINGNHGEEYSQRTPPTKPEFVVIQPQAPYTSQISTPTTGPAGVQNQARRKWATKDEMQDEHEDLGSNAWGSAAPSDATHASNISDERFGKLLHRSAEQGGEGTLADWEGKIIAPPPDWGDRPRYNNNNSEFKMAFKEWLENQKDTHFSSGVPCLVMTTKALEDEHSHADGISLTKRMTFVDINDAKHYGYTHDVADTMKYAQHMVPMDFKDWGKLDLADPDNFKFHKETTDNLVSNWIQHLQNSRVASIEAGSLTKESEDTKSEEDIVPILSEQLYSPELNIYLRPATITDVPELTKIYNWHITHSTAPSETDIIGELEMRKRLELCEESYLPFIVAAKKNQKGAPEIALKSDEELAKWKNLPVKHKQRRQLTRTEQLAGFACAQDLTAPDFVEHISAELEVYVHPEYKRQGVGKCLIDKITQICDRGHRMLTSCDFHCDQRVRQTYSPGGHRDVHKMWILVRKWHRPRPAVISIEGKRKHRKHAFAKTNEEDIGSWMKAWLESLGFEEEGFLRKIGAKCGRYIDMVYFSRETAWQPTEGAVPGPDPRHVVGSQDLEADEDEDDGV